MVQEKYMFAVKGVYGGGETVQLEKMEIPVEGQCDVIVTFLNPANQTETNAAAADLAGRKAGFQKLMKYSGTLKRNIDYKKELLEALDEKYGRLD
jgi:hypothetical protein